MSEYLLSVISRYPSGDDVIVDITATEESRGSYFAGRVTGVKWTEAKEKLKLLHLRPTDSLNNADVSLRAGFHTQLTANCSSKELKDAGF
jgi:hypothetical protein